MQQLKLKSLHTQLESLNEQDIMQQFENPYIAIQEAHDQQIQEPEKIPVLERGEVSFLVLHGIHVIASFLH